MIFLFVFPMLAGFGNYFVPLQIGALDMAYPRVNALSFWLLPVGGLTVLSGFLVKGGAGGGRLDELRAPVGARRERARTSGCSASLSSASRRSWVAINFIVTILRMRAPGMSMFRIPVFCWSVMATSLLSSWRLPCSRPAIIMTLADRHLGTVFFDAARGGNPLLLAERVLVLRPPRGLHPDPRRLGHRQRDPAGLLGQAALRLPGHRARVPHGLRALVHGVGAPHVRDRSGGAAVLQRHDRDDLDPDGGPVLQLARDAATKASSDSNRPCCSRWASSRCS